MQSTIRLFKALPVSDETPVFKEDAYLESVKGTAKDGYVLDRKAFSKGTDVVKAAISDTYGRNSEQLNQAFHKSFAKVKTASMEQLVLEQIVHYFTTYGAERLGIYDENNVYIPAETLEAPELKDGIRLVVIRGLTNAELKVEVLKLLKSGIALSEQSVKDAIDVVQYVGFSKEDVELVKNKEVKTALYDYYGIVPASPTEFLRYVIYRATERTLFIKNRATFELIKARNNNDVVRYFELYEEQYGLDKLASVFYRYKPLFLAFRTNSVLKKKINKIRRLAVANHKPMQEDLLNSITARLKDGDAPTAEEFTKALENANTFRKIRLAYALKFRTTDADSILYKVRNGKSYATSFEFDNKKGAEIIYNIIRKSIIEDIRPNVEGKTFFIPEKLHYALPATEKQFTGNLPSGTYVEVENDMGVGVWWKNLKNYRVDLDLSLISIAGKIGWDSAYRNDSRDVLFSGDVIDAPGAKGATEIHHIGATARGLWSLNLNYYNFSASNPVPFKLMVTHESPRNLTKNYVVDPNNIVALANSEIGVHQTVLGIVSATDEHTRFYFSESQFESGISARNTEASEQARKFLLNNYQNSISLNDLLVEAGATIVTEMAEDVVDLSPEAIDKTSIIELLTPVEE